MAAFLCWVLVAVVCSYVSASHHHFDYYAKPKYHFKYGVDDPKHGDHHSQWEHRDGDKVEGGYSIKDADGTWRHVTYTSDKKTGFNAVVQRHGKAVHPYGHHGHHENYETKKVDSRTGSGGGGGGGHSAALVDVGQGSYPDGAYGYVG